MGFGFKLPFLRRPSSDLVGPSYGYTNPDNIEYATAPQPYAVGNPAFSFGAYTPNGNVTSADLPAFNKRADLFSAQNISYDPNNRRLR